MILCGVDSAVFVAWAMDFFIRVGRWRVCGCINGVWENCFSASSTRLAGFGFEILLSGIVWSFRTKRFILCDVEKKLIFGRILLPSPSIFYEHTFVS